MREVNQISKNNSNGKNIASAIILLCIFLSLVFQLLFDFASIFTNYSLNYNLFLNVYLLLFFLIIHLFIHGINKHFLLLSFYVCMFTFLMGQKLFVVLDGGSFDEFLTFRLLKLSGAEYFTFINLLYFSLFALSLGYWTAKPQKVHVYANADEERTAFEFMQRMRKILRVLYVITFLCALIMQLKIVISKGSLSYTDGYLVNVDVNPIIKIGNYMFIGIAFLYLACKPKKSEMFAVLFSFILVEGVLQLFVGRRALIAQVALFICWYCICYFKYDQKKLKWKHILLLIVLAIALIVLFYMVELFRGNGRAGSISLMEIMNSFFVSTGGSDSTIANAIHYRNEFPKTGAVYFFAPLSDAVTDNALIRLFISVFTGKSVTSSAQGMNYLMQHDTFSHWLSYIVNPELYLSGYGMGSSYIAETYMAFGVVGVAVFSFLLGILIKKFKDMNNDSNKVYRKALIMFFVYNLFMLPRGSVFSSATDLLYLAFSFFIVKVIYELIYNSSKKACLEDNHGRVS